MSEIIEDIDRDWTIRQTGLSKISVRNSIEEPRQNDFAVILFLKYDTPGQFYVDRWDKIGQHDKEHGLYSVSWHYSPCIFAKKIDARATRRIDMSVDGCSNDMKPMHVYRFKDGSTFPDGSEIGLFIERKDNGFLRFVTEIPHKGCELSGVTDDDFVVDIEATEAMFEKGVAIQKHMEEHMKFARNANPILP